MAAPIGSLTKSEIEKIRNIEGINNIEGIKVYWVSPYSILGSIRSGDTNHLTMTVCIYFFRNYFHAWAHMHRVDQRLEDSMHEMWDKWQ